MTASPAFNNAQQHDDSFPAFPNVMDNQTESMEVHVVSQHEYSTYLHTYAFTLIW